jgi:hypothetical protein
MPLNKTLVVSFMLGVAVIGAFASQANAAAQEGIVYNPTTGDYTVTYKSGYSGQLEVVTFIPATKIDPSVKSVYKTVEYISMSDKGRTVFSYEYKLKNGAKSQQRINQMIVLVRSLVSGSLASPEGWPGNAVLSLGGGGVRLSWSTNERGELPGLAPGAVLKDMALESLDLPGVTRMEITGNHPITKWMSHYPAGEVGDQMDLLLNNDFVPRMVAVPRIPVPNPFDAATVLASLKTHIDQDLVALKLVEPALVTELDRWLDAAIAAAKTGNSAALKVDIKELRKLLKREYEDVDKENAGEDFDDENKNKSAKRQIDKLAARVLDFDLKYVERLVKGEKD